jgi:uncharacterized protein (TIGR02246 family)
MRIARSTACIVALAGALASSGYAAEQINPLAQVSVEWARDWQAKKLDDVLSLYADDAVFMDADGSRVSGKAALRKFFAGVLQQYTAHLSLHSVDNASDGALGYDWGDYSEIVESVAKPVHAIKTRGTYLVILRKAGGRWLIAEQMWTGNVPVPVKK